MKRPFYPPAEEIASARMIWDVGMPACHPTNRKKGAHVPHQALIAIRIVSK